MGGGFLGKRLDRHIPRKKKLSSTAGFGKKMGQQGIQDKLA